MTQIPPPGTPGFSGLGIAPRLLEVIADLGFHTPTPIQERSIPTAIAGQDMIGVAQTGTGKTLAFGIPMIQRLAQVKGRGLIVLPTRELALQVEVAIQQIGRKIDLRTVVLIGGASMFNQRTSLNRHPHIIIATPGRLLDHMEQRTIRLDDIKILVLDEADRMLDMGFAPQLNRILKAVPRERQTLLFSATMPNDIITIARTHMHLPIQVEIARSGTAAEKIQQEIYFVAKEEKVQLLEQLLNQHRGSILVFTRTKHGAKKLARQVKQMGHTTTDIHSNRSLSQRREALDGFRAGRYRVLVATDIAARGIDVSGIELVINFDLPSHAEDYVHRIGRTGRAGQSGLAVSFAQPDQRRDIKDIERLIRATLPVKQLPVLPPRRAVLTDHERVPWVTPTEGRLGRQHRRRPYRSFQGGPGQRGQSRPGHSRGGHKGYGR